MKLEANKFYKARNGHKARVLCTDAPGYYTCVGYVYCEDGTIQPRQWCSNGDFHHTLGESKQDLISEWVDEPKTRKVTLRRALLRHPVEGQVFISSYSNEDFENSCLFIRFVTKEDIQRINDGLPIEVPAGE